MKTPAPLRAKHVYLMSSGDLRLSANQKCWAEQAKMETALSKTLRAEAWNVVRAHAFDKQKQHGFIDSQKMGMEVFRKLDPNAPLIVAECVWQYSHHVLAGLMTHQGPILTVANWSGTWPGLVGMLNLNGSVPTARRQTSPLYYETRQASDGDARAVRTWMEQRGMKFQTGPNHDEHLTDEQIHKQCQM